MDLEDESSSSSKVNQNIRLKVESYNTNISWSVYIQRLKNKFKLHDVPLGKQVLILLDVIGLSTYERLVDLCEPETPESKSFEELESILGSFFEQKRNKYAERLKSSKCVQENSETIQDFAARLKGASRYCKFQESWLKEALITQFINGINKEDYRQKIFSLEEIKDFNFLVEFTSNLSIAEDLSKHNYTVLQKEDSIAVHKVSSKVDIQKESCFRCNRNNHVSNDCYFRKSICRQCGEKGHISRACKKNKSELNDQPKHSNGNGSSSLITNSIKFEI